LDVKEGILIHLLYVWRGGVAEGWWRSSMPVVRQVGNT
jgi:hypothetical protein